MLRRRLRPVRRPVPVNEPPADPAETLRRLAALPIGYWSYGWEPVEIRHLGPMAQDFWETFGLGSNDRVISMVDANGVLIASVKALLDRIEQLEQRVAELEDS